jgi:hypothetical protein
MRFFTFALALASTTALAAPEAAVEKGEEVDISSAAVTALTCALQARDHGDLEALNNCPLSEALGEIVVYDVADEQIYRFAKTKTGPKLFELEKAFAGGSIDFAGVVKTVDKDAVAEVGIETYTVTPKPKAGHFKGCL